MIRLLFTDGNALTRETLRIGVGAAVGLEIVGEAAIGNELLAQLPGVEATVVPFDLGLPGPDAFALLAALREQCPHLRMHWPAESSPTSITWRRPSIWEPTATSSKTRCHRSFCTAWARWRLAGRLYVRPWACFC